MTHGSMTSGLMTRRSLWIALLLVWSLGPMLWQLLSSFTTADALVNDQLSFWSRWTLNNYRDLLSTCLLYTSPSPRDGLLSRMPSSA